MESTGKLLPLGDLPTVGAFAAKTHLASLLDRVEAGEVIIITRNQIPVARLEPVKKVQANMGGNIFEQFCEFQRCHKIERGFSTKDFINEGRQI